MCLSMHIVVCGVLKRGAGVQGRHTHTSLPRGATQEATSRRVRGGRGPATKPQATWPPRYRPRFAPTPTTPLRGWPWARALHGGGTRLRPCGVDQQGYGKWVAETHPPPLDCVAVRAVRSACVLWLSLLLLLLVHALAAAASGLPGPFPFAARARATCPSTGSHPASRPTVFGDFVFSTPYPQAMLVAKASRIRPLDVAVTIARIQPRCVGACIRACMRECICTYVSACVRAIVRRPHCWLNGKRVGLTYPGIESQLSRRVVRLWAEHV